MKIRFRTFGIIDEETGAFMVRIDKEPLFYGETLQDATELAVNFFLKKYD